MSAAPSPTSGWYPHPRKRAVSPLHRCWRASRVTSVRHQHGVSGVERATASLDVGDVLVAEELDRRHHRAGGAIAQRAERLSQDGVRDIRQLVDVLEGALAGFQPLIDLVQPEGALPAR